MIIFFCLYHLSIDEAYLTVKPMYVDDSWWKIFEIPENSEEPTSLRDTGAFSLCGERIGTYDVVTGDWKAVQEADLDVIWQEVFIEADADVRRFLDNNPSADTYCPSTETQDRGDQLLLLITWLHQGRTNDVLDSIRYAGTGGHTCTFSSTDGESYDYIIKWCKHHK